MPAKAMVLQKSKYSGSFAFGRPIACGGFQPSHWASELGTPFWQRRCCGQGRCTWTGAPLPLPVCLPLPLPVASSVSLPAPTSFPLRCLTPFSTLLMVGLKQPPDTPADCRDAHSPAVY